MNIEIEFTSLTINVIFDGNLILSNFVTFV